MISNYRKFGENSPNFFKDCKIGRLVLILLFSILTGSCQYELDNLSTIAFHSEEVLLQENFKPISPIISFDILDDGSIILITERQEIVHYSSKGKQISFNSNFGQGELEIYSPSLIQAYDKGYVVWDHTLMKMIEFDKDHQPVLEYKGFNRAIKDFKVDENYFYCYINALPDEPYIQIYSKKTNSLVQEMGALSNSDVIGNLNKCAGGMTFLDNDLLFLSSSSLNVFRVNHDRLEKVKAFLLEDKSIEFKKFDGDPVAIINSDISKAIEFSMSTSIITGIHHINKNILVMGETGTTDFDGNSLDLSKRKTFYILFDRNFDFKAKSFLDYDVNSSCRLWIDSNGLLYNITRREGEEEFEYYLNKISLSY